MRWKAERAGKLNKESEPGGFKADTRSGFYMLSAPSRGHGGNAPVAAKSQRIPSTDQWAAEKDGTVRPFIRKASGREVRRFKTYMTDDIGREEAGSVRETCPAEASRKLLWTVFAFGRSRWRTMGKQNDRRRSETDATRHDKGSLRNVFWRR